MDVTADKIIYGNIPTVDKDRPKASAVAVADGKFIYVGDETGAEKYMGDDTQVLRYESGIILPGLGEGHGHVAPGGTEALFMVNMFTGRSLDEYRSMIKKHAQAHPDWDVILGTGFLPIPDLFGEDGPTADMLEGITDKPVVISDIGHHSYWVNHATIRWKIRRIL